MYISNRRRLPSIIDTYKKLSLVPPKGILFPGNLGLVLSFNLIYNLEAVAALLKKFHGVGIGPLSKILAVK